MKVSAKDWALYVKRLGRLSRTAADKMTEYIEKNGTENLNAITEYAHALITKYGEGAASMACEMYDALARVQHADVPPAVPSETAPYWETKVAMKGTSDLEKPEAVSRLVKRAAADTTVKNAVRDNAQFAWIPSGDSCAFCLTIASRGWQYASKNSLKNGHAEHIHANCDCQYAIRFDQTSTVHGYDPEKYREMYDSAEGSTPQEKINSMRREMAEQARMGKTFSNEVALKALDAPGYKAKFASITQNDTVNQSIYDSATEMLKHRSGTDGEDLYLINEENGSVIYTLKNSTSKNGVDYDERIIHEIESAHKRGERIIAVHNHPNGLPPTLDDGSSALLHGYDFGVVVGHNLEVYTYTSSRKVYPPEACQKVHDALSRSIGFDVDFDESKWYNALQKYGMEVERK